MQHLAALVPYGSGGFDEKQTARGIIELHPAPAEFARDVVMIGGRIIRIEAEAKPALAGEGPVSSAAVTTGLG